MAPLFDYASQALSSVGIQFAHRLPTRQKTLELLFCEIMGKLSGPSTCVRMQVCVRGDTRLCIMRGMLFVSKCGIDLYSIYLVTEWLADISKFSQYKKEEKKKKRPLPKGYISFFFF